jgi:adenosylcobinamide-GDP ribazoletransferase
VPLKRELTPAQLGRATTYFPLVGLIIGVILAVLNWLLYFVLPPGVINALLIVVLVIVTGAMHVDGFADTCDGIAGHKTVEERWRVMRDSRTGAFGVVGIVLLLLVKYVSLNNIPSHLTIPALIFMPAVSRWAMVYAIFFYPYARPEGLGMVYKKHTHWPQFIIATAVTLALAAALIPLFWYLGFIMVFGVWMVTALLALYLKHKLAGLTGDTYGAINEVAETTALWLAVLTYTIAVNLK